jgi:4-amino-4-deoxy-L-arabinose transferase-like glycosyltransferase
MPSLQDGLGNIVRRLDEPQHFSRFMILAVGIALLVRLGVLAFFWRSWDWQVGVIPDHWDLLAINLVDHHTFGFTPNESTVGRGPIFPIFEVPFYLVLGKAYAGWSIGLLLLDTFTCFLLIVTARRLWGNRTALLAGLLYAINLPITFYTAKISQLTSVIPLVVIWMYLFSLWDEKYKSKWLPWVLGLVSGLMILNKTVYLPIPFVGVAVLLWGKRSEISNARLLKPALLYLAIVVAVMAPWTARNYIVTKGSIVPVQNGIWELFVQDVLYDDLNTAKGGNRPEGELLNYFLTQEAAILGASGIGADRPANLNRAQWEIKRERTFTRTAIAWVREDPLKILRIKIGNVWHFWTRAENRNKTMLLVLMQIVYLGAAIAGLILLLKHHQLGRIKYGLVLILVLWAEHCPVFAWGRFSLDLVPALGVMFGLGIDAWARQAPLKAVRL